jgi:glycosyltransferase involved in cell wall biosynthesis
LRSPVAEEFDLIHIRSNLKTSNAAKGAFSFRALGKQLAIYGRIVGARLRGCRALYVLLAVNVFGFAKDAGSVWLATLLGMEVAAHMKGATLPSFYSKSPSVMRWFIRTTVRRLSLMIIQASSIRDEIAATFKIPSSRLPVIPNMVDAIYRYDHRVPGHNLLFIGHLSVGKGFVDLLSVMESVLAHFPDAHLRCAGEPKSPQRDYVARLVDIPTPPDAMELIDNALKGGLPGVEYLGLVHGRQKEELYQQADIVVLPSFSESFPMVVLEAMSHGCAIVTTTVGAVPDMIADGVEGILCRPGDRQGLARAILTLLADPDLRTRLGDAARAKVEASYTVASVVPLYRDAFWRLVRRTGA